MIGKPRSGTGRHPSSHGCANQDIPCAANGVRNRAEYDITADGRRMLVLRTERSAAKFEVVPNWWKEIKARMPSGKAKESGPSWVW